MRKTGITIISIGLVLAAVAIAKIIVALAPKAERKRPPKTTELVDIRKLQSGKETIILNLTGTVIPAQQVKLQARVSGEIIDMSPDFMDGVELGQGLHMLTIDPVDYQLALTDAESKLENARFAYKTELGRQEIARYEWELLKTDDATELEKELALRKPHLAADKAALAAAEAVVQKAKLNLERTEIKAPFNAIVIQRNANIGSQVNPQTELGTLVGTDVYWVKVSIPVDRLHRVKIPGSDVRIISSSGSERHGKVLELLGDLEEKGRMARLLVEVKDPLCLKPENRALKPLLLGEYVRAEISGEELDAVFALPRRALREGSNVWIAKDGKLDIRQVDVLWSDSEKIIIRDALSDGEMLIISDLTAPVQNMDVADSASTAKKAPDGKQPEKNKRPANKE